MPISNILPNECCGCSACKAICPVQAISFEPDAEGFLYPVVNNHTCILCEKCSLVCSNRNNFNKSPNGSFAAKNIRNEILKQSSSGGVSNSLCSYIISIGGVVYGVEKSKNWLVRVCRSTNVVECERYFGSKYVQADPGMTFFDVYNDLTTGKTVLYISTSCYIAGLLSYLERKNADITNLFTVDLICHGVPSPKVFKDYINWIDNKNNIQDYYFRTKEKPWGYGSKNFGCTIIYKNGKKEIDSIKSRVFLNLFFSNNCLRPHCHACPYASVNKPADITLADYWGCKDYEPDFFDSNGVSACITHSNKGLSLLKSLSDIEMKPTSLEYIIAKQGNLRTPSKSSPNRTTFWSDYSDQGFDYIAKTYGGYNLTGFLKTTRFYQYYVKYMGKLRGKT